jgi:hypothetical protein
LALHDYRARYYDPALGRFVQADTVVPEPGNPQALNRYAYVYNNPLKYTDPSGHWLETAWDILNIGWDLYEVYRDPRNAWNWVALAADVGAAILPVVPGGVGLVVRGGRAAGAAVEVASHLDEAADVGRIVAEAASHADEAADVMRAGTRATEVLRGTEQTVRRAVEQLPQQMHHFATNKSSKWTNQMAEIARKYGLDLDEAWNKELLPHGRGRHPDAYHEWVLEQMRVIDKRAQSNVEVIVQNSAKGRGEALLSAALVFLLKPLRPAGDPVALPPGSNDSRTMPEVG